jgi:DNA-binding beta-propeller fold protein YncE
MTVIRTKYLFIAVSIFLSFFAGAQPEHPDRDLQKWREERFKQAKENSAKDAAKSREGESIRKERGLTDAQVVEYAAMSGVAIPETAKWFNVNGKLERKDLVNEYWLLVAFELQDLVSGYFVKQMNDFQKVYKHLSFIGLTYSSADMPEEELLNALREAECEFPVAVLSDQKSFPEVLGNTIPSAMVVSKGFQPTRQLLNPESNPNEVVLLSQIDSVVKILTPLGARVISKFKQDERLSFYPTPIMQNPGFLEADEENKLLFVADRGNHRILVFDEDGDVVKVIGRKKSGMADGSFESAQFHLPGGMAFNPEENALYIADTYNHAIRRADMSTLKVTTLTGDGKPGKDISDKAAGKNAQLAYPTGIRIIEGRLLVASAGMHRVLEVDMKNGDIRPFAGSGKPGRAAGKIQKTELDFPTAITGNTTQSVRVLSSGGRFVTEIGRKKSKELLGPDKKETPVSSMFDMLELAGKTYISDPEGNVIYKLENQSLIPLMESSEFGLSNGPKDNVRVFRPTGMTSLGGKVYFSDSYNHVIRVFDPANARFSVMPVGDYDQAVRETLKPGSYVHVATGEELVLKGNASVKLKFQLPENIVMNGMKNNFIEFMKESGNTLTDFDTNEGTLTFDVSASDDNLMIYFELHAHFTNANHPEVKYFQVVRVMIPLIFDSSGVEKAEVGIQLFP